MSGVGGKGRIHMVIAVPIQQTEVSKVGIKVGRVGHFGAKSEAGTDPASVPDSKIGT